MLRLICDSITWVLFWYFLIIMSFYVVLILISIPTIYKRFYEVGMEDVSSLLKSETLPTISLIIPVYNMKQDAITTIYNAIELEYSAKDIIIVNDGSTDESLEMLIKEFAFVEVIDVFPKHLKTQPVRKIFHSMRFSNVRLIDKENGGKNDSNNAGINLSMSELFLVIDGDTVLEKDALLRMIRPFFTNPRTVAQGGTLRILNGCDVERGKIYGVKMPKKAVEGIQVVEYLRSFLYGRLGWNHLGGNLIVSGAFGLFDRKTVIKVGGYEVKTLAEDFELTVKLSKYQRDQGKGQGIFFIPDPVAWTFVPDTWKWLGNQRARWHQGLFEVLMMHKDATFATQYGMTGMIGIPYMWLGELFEPIAEVLGYTILILGLCLGWFGFGRVLLFMSIAWGFSAIVTLISVLLEITTFRRYESFKDLGKMFWFTLIENFGYRQISVWWRLRGFARYFRKSKEW